MTQAVRAERQHAARKSSRQQKKFDDTLATEKAAAEETIKTLKHQFEKERTKRIAEMEEVLDKLAKERTTWQTYREELVDQVDSANAKFVSEKKEVALLSNRNSTDLQNKSLNFEIKSSNWKG